MVLGGGCCAMVLWARPGRDQEERTVVRRLSRARKAPCDAVMRARMIELSWSGLRVPAIAVELDCSQKTVRGWLHRFNRMGLQSLEDLVGRAANGGSPRRNDLGSSPWSRPCHRGGSSSSFASDTTATSWKTSSPGRSSSGSWQDYGSLTAMATPGRARPASGRTVRRGRR